MVVCLVSVLTGRTLPPLVEIHLRSDGLDSGHGVLSVRPRPWRLCLAMGRTGPVGPDSFQDGRWQGMLPFPTTRVHRETACIPEDAFCLCSIAGPCTYTQPPGPRTYCSIAITKYVGHRDGCSRGPSSHPFIPFFVPPHARPALDPPSRPTPAIYFPSFSISRSTTLRRRAS